MVFIERHCRPLIMNKFAVLSPSNRKQGSRFSGIHSLLLALLLSAASGAWSMSADTDSFSGKGPSWAEDYSGAISAIESAQDVVVFPIRIAGTGSVSPGGRIANKIAQVAGVGGIAVIYPDIGEPYRSVFTQIIDGIEDKAKGHVANFAIGPNVDVNELNNSLRRQDTRVVIALGRQGMKVASALDNKIGVVVGGVLTAADDGTRTLQVNSLSPDPALLFSRLKKMMPNARRVLTVYDPRQNEWLIRLAKEGAAASGLELVAYPAQDLRGAMRAYQEIVAGVDSGRDALWLPQDSTTVEESTVMPFVLQESWNSNLAVFSSSFGHVKRGVLFSLYPDNVELGRHLASDALDLLASGGRDGAALTPLREVLMAVNLRTAKHLGLNTGRLQSFDMAFPEQ
jgi:putative ABC transport system substrate-binding protein